MENLIRRIDAIMNQIVEDEYFEYFAFDDANLITNIAIKAHEGIALIKSEIDLIDGIYADMLALS